MVLPRYIALAFCAACASSFRASRADLLATYPVHATGHTINGELAESLFGKAYVYEDEILLVVASGFAELRPSATRRPIGWSAGLSFCHTQGESAGKWDFRRQTSITPVRRIKARGDTLSDSVAFVISRVRGLDLKAHWLTIQQHSHISPDRNGLWYESTRPIHSQAFVFDTDSARNTSRISRCNEDH